VLAEVVTVNVVLAFPLEGVTEAGLKVQVMPVTVEQENVTLFAKPPEGATVSMNGVDWPAVTVAAEGAAAREKSAGGAVTSTGAEALLAKKATSPLYNAVMLCVLTPERTALKLV